MSKVFLAKSANGIGFIVEPSKVILFCISVCLAKLIDLLLMVSAALCRRSSANKSRHFHIDLRSLLLLVELRRLQNKEEMIMQVL